MPWESEFDFGYQYARSDRRIPEATDDHLKVMIKIYRCIGSEITLGYAAYIEEFLNNRLIAA